MKAKTSILRVSMIILILVLAVPAWNFIRVNSYTDKDRTVTLSNGQKVSVHLTEVTRIAPDKVKVSMDFMWKTDRDGELVIPDMSITRPLAVRAPFIFPEGCTPFTSDGFPDTINYTYSDHKEGIPDKTPHTWYTALFNLKATDNSIDISQPLYVRSNEGIVELPLATTPDNRIAWRAGDARFELIDFGKSKKYGSGPWRVLSVGTQETRYPPTEGPPADTFCVRMKLTDTDGPLVEWSAFPRSMQVNTSCSAEIIDSQGQSIPMTANYIAKSDCEFLENETDYTPWKQRVLQNTVRTISFGRMGINVSHGSKMSMYMPGNGEWLYVFKPKPNRKYTKIRIHYILPPKPQDKATVRFDKVPI